MHKAYVVLLTCSTSRAVILDQVEDNTSKNFINLIKTFTVRKCCPNNIF